MSKEALEYTLKVFDIQLKRESKFTKEDECVSYWNKLLFMETINLTPFDWKQIRVGDYWEIRNSLFGVKQAKFILSRIKKYKNNQ